MSAKNRDRCNRWRSKTVSFRVSLEENEQLNTFVKLSGMTKQDYIIRRLTSHTIIIQGNPRVYKALKNQLEASCAELQRIKKAGDCTPEFLDILNQITLILKDMKEDTYD